MLREKSGNNALQSTKNPLDVVVRPESVALVGITVNNPEHWTRTFLDSLLEFGFDRPIFLVNPKGGEIRGRKVYTSLEEVPSTIDYVISTVPARASAELVRQCASKGTKVVHFCTAGFSETGSKEGAEMERQLVAAGRETSIRLLGPNCMGIYCPETHLAIDPDFPKEAGPVAFISQSGANVNQLVRRSATRGIRFSKAFSFGNACDLGESDILEYLADDPATEIIAIYIEGVKDGRRFRKALEKAVAVKPVVLLKGGVTAGGARAVFGHTGALAGSEATWDALYKQTGVISVSSMDEMVDVLVALRFMPVPQGNRTLVVGAGGGASVMMTDQVEKTGLSVPALPQDVVERLREFSSDAGNILRNPVDYSQDMWQPGKLVKMAEVTTASSVIDLLLVFLSAGLFSSKSSGKIPEFAEMIVTAMKGCSKPAVAVIELSVSPEQQALIFPLFQELVLAKFPVFFSASSAARAISALLEYNQRKQKRERLAA
ncbi:MAG: CoA-binding protein [Sterolibacterium sp.]